MRLDYTNLKRVKVPFQPKIEMGPVYYPTFAEYKKTCQGFFYNLENHAQKLGALLTENFEIIRN